MDPSDLPPRQLSYDVVDVFAERPFEGNQLAVVHGADGLSKTQQLALAREFNYSETTFPAPRTPQEYDVRIYTVDGEIPFAGHPTLGTAWVLRGRGELSGDEAVQRCGAGRIGVTFGRGDDRGGASQVELTAAPRDLFGPIPHDLTGALLADLGLEPGDLAGEAFVAGTGLSWVHLPVRPDAVARARPSTRPLSSYGERLDAGMQDPVEGVNVVSITGEAPSLDVHARVFVPGLSIAEDPATGSAAAGLGMALVADGRLPKGGTYTIRQGLEMGRPSLLRGTVVAERGSATMCRVAGEVHPVASGTIAVPEG